MNNNETLIKKLQLAYKKVVVENARLTKMLSLMNKRLYLAEQERDVTKQQLKECQRLLLEEKRNNKWAQD